MIGYYLLLLAGSGLIICGLIPLQTDCADVIKNNRKLNILVFTHIFGFNGSIFKITYLLSFCFSNKIYYS